MNKQKYVRQEMRRLQRSMDFLSRHPALDKPGREGRGLAEVYQQLGRAWELLALQCRHRAGWRKLKGGARACKMCGTLKGAKETWLLLPRTGPKVIGRMSRPTTKSILPTRKAATVLSDKMSFHGAQLSIEVLNPHRSRLFRTRDISVAADRLVELHESDVVCKLADHTVGIRVGLRPSGSEPPYGAFLSELPRKVLTKFPVMVEYDRQGRFVGVLIFRERKRATTQGKGGRRTV